MAAIAPRVAELEKSHAILRRDHDCLADEVHNETSGLPAAHKRLNENDVLSAQVKIFIKVGIWVAATFGASVLLLIWNLVTHSVEIVRP